MRRRGRDPGPRRRVRPAARRHPRLGRPGLAEGRGDVRSDHAELVIVVVVLSALLAVPLLIAILAIAWPR